MSFQDANPELSAKALELERQVRERFGMVPNFFLLSRNTPEITANLWGFAQAAYLDNPLPTLFKERLFVHLSRFCDVRYCIARHAAFLIGLGRAAGDARSSPQMVEQVVSLLRRPFPRGKELQALLALEANYETPLAELPGPDSELELAIFAFAGHVFLQTSEAPASLEALSSLLGATRLEYLILLLSFVRTAHYWTKVHGALAFEDDVRQLLATQEALAQCILNDPEARAAMTNQRILVELPLLQQQAERASGLLAAIVDSSDDAIVSKTLEGVITSWNQSAERLFGYKAEEAIGQHILLIVPRDRWPEEQGILDKIRRGERVDHFETKRVRKDGSMVEVSLCISPVRDSSGRIIGASKVARDITAKKHSDEILAKRARQQRALFQLADQLHRAESLEQVYKAGLDAIEAALHCNRAAISVIDNSARMQLAASRGLSAACIAASDGHCPWGRDDRDPAPIVLQGTETKNLPKTLNNALERDGLGGVAFIPLVSQGRLMGSVTIWFQSTPPLQEEEYSLSLTIGHQVAFAIDRKRSEAALRQSEERFRTLSATLDAEVRIRTRELEQRNAEVLRSSKELRNLSRQMMQIQDEERRRIARELHDSAGQLLAVLSMNLAQLTRDVRPELKKQAEDIEQLVQQLTQEIRTTSYLLHPPLLDETGLSAALSWYVQGLTERSHLEIGLCISEDLGRLSPDLELVIFRIVQECLTNVHRHSDSKSAAIRLERNGDNVCVEVVDHGKGIVPERLTEIQSQASGVGIQGMRERARQFHGDLKIESSNGSGTRILVTLPIHPPNSGRELTRRPLPAAS